MRMIKKCIEPRYMTELEGLVLIFVYKDQRKKERRKKGKLFIRDLNKYAY